MSIRSSNLIQVLTVYLLLTAVANSRAADALGGNGEYEETILIIWQSDDDVRPYLQSLIDKGAASDIVSIAGHHVLLHEAFSKNSPRGAYINHYGIYLAVIRAAEFALSHPSDEAILKVIFMFHQTTRAAVSAINTALHALEPDVLDIRAQAAGKNLWVNQVVLLSCESAADKAAPSPAPPVMDTWITQAKRMRSKAIKAFTIRRVTDGGEYVPVVVTFSNNVETGSVVLDPFGVRFYTLHGRFTADGSWDYDRDANGQEDKTKDPSRGTIYSDTGQPGGARTEEVPENGHVNFLPFTRADIR